MSKATINWLVNKYKAKRTGENEQVDDRTKVLFILIVKLLDT